MERCSSHLIGVALIILCLSFPATAQPRLFDARIGFMAGEYPAGVAIGHLDGDGIPDLVLGNAALEHGDQNSILVCLGIGDGSFQAPVIYPTGSNQIRTLELADLDGDGDLDLVVLAGNTDYFIVLLGNGDGTFQEPLDQETGYGQPRDFIIGDLDEDSILDLAVLDSQDFGKVYRGNGDGTFQAGSDFFTGERPLSIAVDDLNGDGFLDLVTADNESESVSVIIGLGNGHFYPPAHYETGPNNKPYFVNLGDLNHDGIPDLTVTTSRTSNNLKVLMGVGDGTFNDMHNYAVDGDPYVTAIGDINGDSHPDLAVMTWNESGITLLMGFGDGTFQAPTPYVTDPWPHDIALGDLDGDDYLDLAVINHDLDISASIASVFMGNGDGTLKTPPTLDCQFNPYGVAAGDLDGDGLPDLVTANHENDRISVFPGNGDGTFETALHHEVGDGPLHIAMGDLDGNGIPDLAVTNQLGRSVEILSGNGDGTFETLPDIPTGSNTNSAAIGDLNGDGTPDLAVSLHSSILVALGTGDGSFEAAGSFNTGPIPRLVVIGDLDQDSIPDLATVVSSTNAVSILLGNGDGSFQNPLEFPVGDTPFTLVISDLNHDGTPDLAAVNYFSHDVSVLIGYGDGTFQAKVNYRVSLNPRSIVTGDLDGDGNSDLAVANGHGDNVSVLHGSGDGTFRPVNNYSVGVGPRTIAVADLYLDGSPDLVTAHGQFENITVLVNILNPDLLIVGPGPDVVNSPLVRLFPPVPGAAPVMQITAYGATQYGVNVSSGDPDGDGVDEILTGAGPGPIYGPHVRGFEADGAPLAGLDFLAYGTHKYGVNVCCGDLDGNGQDEIITGAGPGAVFGPHVRGWNYDGSSVSPLPGVSYFAYGTPKWGVNVTAGDIDGDGHDEIITGPGPGAVYGPHVRSWNVDGGVAAAIPGGSFLAYGTNKFGVNVSAGDVDGDGIDEIVTGAGPGAVFGPHIRGWNYDNTSVTPLPGFNFFAWDTEPLSFGVNVFAGADLNGDGRDELVAGRGPDPNADSEVKVFTYDGTEISQWLSLETFPGYTHGTNVAAGRF